MHAPAAIFDLDGTLFDTFDEHHAAWRHLCAEHGVPLTPELFAWSFGRRNEEIIPELWRRAGLPVPSGESLHRLAEAKEGHFRRHFAADPRPIAGAVELLRSLRVAGWRLAAGSSAPPANVAAFVAALPADASFDATVSGADVARGKPDPEVFLRAAERLGAPPSCALVFEDAAPGIEAAHRAGMRCVAVASPGRTREELRAAELVVDDFTSLRPAHLRSLLDPTACRLHDPSPAPSRSP